jgi:hypothetical protein
LEAERLGIESLGEVPLDPTIRKTSGAGTPITVAEPDNPHALVFRHMAARQLGQGAGEGADRRHALSWNYEFASAGWHGIICISATIKLPHSYPILHHVRRYDGLRRSKGGCWCL